MPDPSPTADVTEPDEALAPMLRWHHLASIVCLSKGTSVPRNEPPSVTTNLQKRLLAASDAVLLAAFNEDQTTSTPDGLLSHVAAIGAIAGKGHYSWGLNAGSQSFPIRFRRALPDGKPRLGVQGLLLPWPMNAGFSTSQGKTLEDRYADAQGPPIPDAYSSEVEPTATMPLDAFMRAVDDAVDAKSPFRDKFGELRHDSNRVLAWLLQQAKEYHGLPANAVLPPLGVNVRDDWTTAETRWKIVGGTLHLVIGWMPSPDLLPMINQWPCGAFQGFIYGE